MKKCFALLLLSVFFFGVLAKTAAGLPAEPKKISLEIIFMFFGVVFTGIFSVISTEELKHNKASFLFWPLVVLISISFSLAGCFLYTENIPALMAPLFWSMSLTMSFAAILIIFIFSILVDEYLKKIGGEKLQGKGITATIAIVCPVIVSFLLMTRGQGFFSWLFMFSLISWLSVGTTLVCRRK